jgi:pyridoxamine 5'-phosphate oxidase
MTTDGFSHLRVEYGDAPLERADLPTAPLVLLRRWLDAATAAGISEPNGMALATVDADGQPQCRIVLLKGLDERGLTFFTNRTSDKGCQLARRPRAAATFWWQLPRNRQVRCAGRIELASDEVSDAYFHSRPRRAQLCSAASPQSQVVADRDQLERIVAALAERVGDGPVPRPPHWGGYVLVPDTIEFWQGRDGRLHDRFRYRAADSGWQIERLGP